MSPSATEHGPRPLKRPRLATERDSEYASLYATKIVTLVVGGPASPAQERSPTKFYIHEPLLVESSPVFRAMLSRPNHDDRPGTSPSVWKEAHTKEIHLPEDRVSDWAMLAKWLYSGGIAANTLSTQDVERLGGLDLLQQIREKQPGLADSAATSAVADFVAWRESQRPKRYKRTIDLSKLVGASAAAQGPSCSGGYMWYRAKTLIDAGQPVEHVEKTLHCNVVGAAAGTTTTTAAAATAQEETAEGLGLPRPAPPALGPLLRLYILTDKYGIDDGVRPRFSSPGPRLKGPCCSSDSADADADADTASEGTTSETSLSHQIVLRLRAINKVANVVPGREDIDRLWSAVVLGEDALKTEVVQMYARMNRRSFESVFGRCSADGGGGDGHARGREGDGGTRLGIHGHGWGDGSADEEWHPAFLRAVMVSRETGAGAGAGRGKHA